MWQMRRALALRSFLNCFMGGDLAARLAQNGGVVVCLQCQPRIQVGFGVDLVR